MQPQGAPGTPGTPGTPGPNGPEGGVPAAGGTPPGWPGTPYGPTPGTAPTAPGAATATASYPFPGPIPPLEPARRTGRSSRLWIGLIGLVAGALIGGGAGAGVTALIAQDAPRSPAAPAQSVVIQNPERATTATAAAAKAASSVVTIYVSKGGNSGSGSGVVLTADGYVLTNNHVVTLDSAGTGQVQVRTSDGTLFDATVVGTDASFDLAVVKLDNAKGLTPATFADSDKVQVGDAAIAIGAPLGLSNTVTEGIISAVDRAVATGSSQRDSTVFEALQTDAAINPGNSGGALLNGAGEVIGINTAIATLAGEGPGQSGQGGNIGVGFAIPSTTAQRVAQEIVRTGKANHAVLGVSARTVSSGSNSEAGTGAQISQVVADGPAAKSGLQSGDIIIAVGDRPVTSSLELTATVRSLAPGSAVDVTVRRGNGTQTVSVTLGTTTS